MPADRALLTLRTVLGDHPLTAPIKDGRIAAPGLRLDQVRYDPVNRAFPEMVRSQAFDIGEMAVATFLLAHSFGKPLVLLPVTVLSRFQQPYLVHNAARGRKQPRDLVGGRIGVRSYTVTTGVWVRGILEQDHGVDHSAVTWVTHEPPHVAEYRNPPNVVVEEPGWSMLDALVRGELDAAVVGSLAGLPPGIEPLLPPAASADWYAAHRVAPINHMVALRQDTAEAHPELPGRLFAMFTRAKAAAGPPPEGAATPFDPYPLGIEACRGSLELIVSYAAAQGVVPEPFPVDDLFHPLVRDLV